AFTPTGRIRDTPSNHSFLYPYVVRGRMKVTVAATDSREMTDAGSQARRRRHAAADATAASRLALSRRTPGWLRPRRRAPATRARREGARPPRGRRSTSAVVSRLHPLPLELGAERAQSALESHLRCRPRDPKGGCYLGEGVAAEQ